MVVYDADRIQLWQKIELPLQKIMVWVVEVAA